MKHPSHLDLLEIVGRWIDGRSRFAHVVDVGVLLAHLVLVLGASLQELFGKLGTLLRFACELIYEIWVDGFSLDESFNHPYLDRV